MATEPKKQKLVNGKPVDDETATSEDIETHSDESAGQTEDEAGAEVKFKPQNISGGDIKKGISDRIERIKKDGPEPVRQAAKGVVDKVFDAIDTGLERWFGEKK